MLQNNDGVLTESEFIEFNLDAAKMLRYCSTQLSRPPLLISDVIRNHRDEEFKKQADLWIHLAKER